MRWRPRSSGPCCGSGFTYYTTNIANYDTAFGPISATISLLVFLYFASVIVLLGAEVARANVLEDARRRS